MSSTIVLVEFGFGLRPLLKSSGGGVVCTGTGELSERERLRIGRRSEFGDESFSRGRLWWWKCFGGIAVLQRSGPYCCWDLAKFYKSQNLYKFFYLLILGVIWCSIHQMESVGVQS